MANLLPPPPINDAPGSFTWLEWYRQLRNYVSTSGSVPWYIINFAGSNITDLATRLHNQLQGLQGGELGAMYHLTQGEHDGLVGGAETSLHKHTVTDINGLGPLATQSAGYTGTVTIAKLTSGGTDGSLTFDNGVLTAVTPAT